MGEIDKATKLPIWHRNAKAIAEGVQEPMAVGDIAGMLVEDPSTITNLAACYLDLRGLLEQAMEGLTPANRDLQDRIRQALHREGGE